MTLSTESDKATVHRFFEEVVDKGNLEIVDELYTTDCIVHRLESPQPIAGYVLLSCFSFVNTLIFERRAIR
jgi:hypothetical protein